MKRTSLAVLSAALLLCGVPSVASAHHGKRHAACRSTHKHHAKCARAHVLSFGPNISAGATGTAPTTPTSGETAGTVSSFVAPILTITLNDTKKTEVTGKITENTRIECESSTPTGSGGAGEGDDDGGSGTGDTSSLSASHDSAMASAADTQDTQDQGGDQGEDNSNIQPCTTSALTLGAVVREAELVLGSEGAVWEKVLLVA